jgi:hypothetical protein
MSISEHFRYRNDGFPSNIFVSDIGITDDNVGCWISPTLRSMLMPTYAQGYHTAKPSLHFNISRNQKPYLKYLFGANGWTGLVLLQQKTEVKNVVTHSL